MCEPAGDLQAHPLQCPQISRGQLRGQTLGGPLGPKVTLQVPQLTELHNQQKGQCLHADA